MTLRPDVLRTRLAKLREVSRLGDHGVIDQALRARLRGLGGFRNVLAHAYLDIDVGRVHEHLQDGLGDFAEFARQIEAFLDRA